MRIAQPLQRWGSAGKIRSPGGTTESVRLSVVPQGLSWCGAIYPPLKRVGYFQVSLRDRSATVSDP